MSDKTLKILLTDDNDIDVKVVKKLLEREFESPYLLLVRKTLEECKSLVAKGTINVLILDLHLPDSTAEQTLQFVKSFGDHLPIIVLSVINDKPLMISAIKKGAQDYLVKNEFDAPLLSRCIHYSIERHLLHKRLRDYTYKLKDKESKLIESQAIAHLGNWELDPYKLSIKWSKEALNILEINNGNNITYLDEFLLLVHRDEKKFVKEIFRQAVEDKNEFNEDIRLVTSDEVTKHVNLRIRSGPAKAAGEWKIIGTLQDISPRKEIESALISTEEKYHRLFEASRDAIYITTEEGEFIDFNHATEELFDYSEDELRDIDVSALYFIPFDRERVKKEIRDKGYVRDFEVKLKKKDGTKMDCIISSTLWKSTDGSQTGFQGIIRDITEMKRTQELIRNKEIAERSARLKERFLANMSHEIRTPINAISGLTHLILKTELNERQSEFATGIKTSSEHLLALVNDILDFSKIEAGKVRFESIRLNLQEHIEQIISTLHHSAEQKGIQLILEHDTVIPKEMAGDPLKLNQIIINLLSNALKFTENGFIKITTRMVEEDEEAAVVSLSVQDTGIGIAENKLETIFRSFTQLGRNITKTAEGTGLGLAITKQLVELQGGTIKVESLPGSGTTFEVTLKFKKKMDREMSEDKDNNHFLVEDIGYKKFLVADDKKLNQLVTGEMMKSWWRNIEVDFADNGQKAVEKAKQKDYDLILMDVQMPEMDGYEATHHIRENFQPPASKVPILAITAYTTEGEAEKCLQSGMNDFLTKPFTPQQLYAKVTGLILSPRSTQSRNTKKVVYTGAEKINLSHLDFLSGENSSVKKKIIDLLITETPDEIERLKTAVDEKNWKRVRAMAHKLKSSIIYLGLSDSLELAKNIEELADAGNGLDKIPGMVEKVTESCTQAVEELKTSFSEKIKE